MQQSKSTNLSKLLRQLATVAMLIVYGFGSFPGDSLHAIVHAREVAELHSIEQENDACHQSLFHADATRGCEHKTHLVIGGKCAFTQIGHQPSHVAAYQQPAQQFEATGSTPEAAAFCVVSAFAGFFSSRAPPAV